MVHMAGRRMPVETVAVRGIWTRAREQLRRSDVVDVDRADRKRKAETSRR
jgi:hypothetical protein